MARKSRTNYIRWFALILVIAAIGVFMALDRQHDPSMDTVATVNGKPIHRYELDREVKNYYDQIGGTQRITDDNIDDLRVSVMDMLIEQKIVLQDAVKKGYKPVMAEIDQHIADQKQQAGSVAGWDAFLSSWGFTEKSFRDYLADMYTVDNYPPTQWHMTEITEEMLQEEFARRKEASPNLVYEDAKEFIRKTMEIDQEIKVSGDWYKALEATSKSKILDQRVLGRKAFAGEDYKAALSHYLKARKGDKNDPYIDVSIAKCYNAMGDDANFRRYFESAVKKDPNNEFVFMARAKILMEKGLGDEAKADVSKSVEVADQTNISLLERIEEMALELDMKDEADRLDYMIRKIMMPNWEGFNNP